MWRKLHQVAVTYVTRPTPLTLLAILLAGVLYLFFFAVLWTGENRDLGTLILALFAGSGAGGLLTDHLRWQFIHPRSALTPQFRAPHLIVWATLAISIIVLVPLITIGPSNASVLPVLCVLAVGMASSLRASVAGSAWIVIIVILVFGDRVFAAPAIQLWMNAEGYRRFVWIGATLLAWTAAIRQVNRFGDLPEDDPRFDAPVVADPNAKVSRTFRMARERAASTVASRYLKSSAWTSAWLDRHIRRAAPLPLWRRLGIVFIERRSPIMHVANAAFFLLMWLIIIFPDHADGGIAWNWDAERMEPAWFFAALGTAACAFIPATRLAGRIPQMTAERLLPMSNQAYADALLGVCLWWTVRAWLAIQAVVLFAVFVLPWEGFDKPSIKVCAAYLAISVAGLTYSFGIGAFCSSMQGCFPVLFAAATSALATLALQGYWMSLDQQDSQAVAMFLAVVFLAAGLWFAFRARLLWRHKELAAALADRFS